MADFDDGTYEGDLAEGGGWSITVAEGDKYIVLEIDAGKKAHDQGETSYVYPKFQLDEAQRLHAALGKAIEHVSA